MWVAARGYKKKKKWGKEKRGDTTKTKHVWFHYNVSPNKNLEKNSEKEKSRIRVQPRKKNKQK